jgi:TPP-dependent pyruvate/acetoin dehydrogenase alpha subunit
VASREELVAIDDAARVEMAAAVAFALDSPYPQPEEALDDVFA